MRGYNTGCICGLFSVSKCEFDLPDKVYDGHGAVPHPEGFPAYMIAHEAHHGGQIVIALKDNKHMPDKKILYGMWEWGVR